jgi:hypothetical protein
MKQSHSALSAPPVRTFPPVLVLYNFWSLWNSVRHFGFRSVVRSACSVLSNPRSACALGLGRRGPGGGSTWSSCLLCRTKGNKVRLVHLRDPFVYVCCLAPR